MRTLKKTLCLVLALVMMLGLCVINVAATDLPDDDKIADDYREAFELANYLKIITGAEIGGQVVANPQGDMTRVQAAYYIARLLKGNYGTGTESQFLDVSGQDAAVVEWMASQGYTTGDGQGYFDPYGKVLGMHFAKWLLTALGYDAEAEGLVGDKWEGQVRVLTAKMGLTRGITAYDQNAVLTREQAAQMILNALEATMYYYPTSNGFGVGGTTVTVTNGATRVPNDTGASYYGTDDTYVQLVEAYYPTLKKVDGSTAVIKEEMNRPTAHIWKDNGKELYRAVASPIAVYTGEMKKNNIASELSNYYIPGSNTAEMYVNSYVRNNTNAGTTTSDFTIYINGAADNSFNATDKFSISGGTITFGSDGISIAEMIEKLCGKGRIVEIYAEDDDDANMITQINVTCFTVAKVNKIDKKNNGETTYTFTKVGGSGNINNTAKTYADAPEEDNLISNAELAKNDIVLLTTNNNNLTDLSNSGDKLYAILAEKQTGTQSSYSKSGKKVTIDGKDYLIATGVADDTTYSTNLLADDEFKANKEVDYYLFNLDGVDYVVYAKEVEAGSTGDYAFIVKTEGKVSSGLDAGVPEIKVRAVLSNGTWGDYKVKTETVKATGANATKARYYPHASAEGEYDVTSGTFDTAYYIITNTDIIIAGGGSANGVNFSAQDTKTTTDNAAKLLMSDLYGYVYNYKLDGDTITLTPLGDKDFVSAGNKFGGNYENGTKTVGKTYAGQTSTPLIKSKQNYLNSVAAAGTAAATGEGVYAEPNPSTKSYAAGTDTVVISANTTLVKFDSSKKEVTVETGVNNLPTAEGSSVVGYYAAKATATDRLAADVVFLVNDGKTNAPTTTSKNYIFVDASKDIKTEKNGNDVVTWYRAWDVNGEIEGGVSSKGYNKTVYTGLYYINENKELTELLLKEGNQDENGSSVTISKDAPYFYAASGSIVDDKYVDSGSNVPASGVSKGNHLWSLNDITAPVNSNDDMNTKKLLVVLKLNAAGELTENIAAVFSF